ncbi:MAG: hypothetical protein GF329_03180 [Candidatus Lokiarchaeota archaeon]|nr:hypothetical protein [Candidatus Lokiarchaeota archaeon]
MLKNKKLCRISGNELSSGLIFMFFNILYTIFFRLTLDMVWLIILEIFIAICFFIVWITYFSIKKISSACLLSVTIIFIMMFPHKLIEVPIWVGTIICLFLFPKPKKTVLFHENSAVRFFYMIFRSECQRIPDKNSKRNLKSIINKSDNGDLIIQEKLAKLISSELILGIMIILFWLFFSIFKYPLFFLLFQFLYYPIHKISKKQSIKRLLLFERIIKYLLYLLIYFVWIYLLVLIPINLIPGNLPPLLPSEELLLIGIIGAGLFIFIFLINKFLLSSSKKGTKN